MKIITPTTPEFQVLCARLQTLVADAGYDFNVIVAIARGGVYVADNFNTEAARFDITLQRPDSGFKQKLLGRILRLLPAPINRILRRVEATVKEAYDSSRLKTEKPLHLPPDLINLLAQGGARVLVVDDAVDSGITMLRVVEAIRRYNSWNQVRTAAITVTRRKLFFNPDWALFRNRTLIRFPWSIDIRKS